MSDYDEGKEFAIRGTISPSYYGIIDYACHYGGRDDLMSSTPYRFLDGQDLHFAEEKRREVYKQMGEDPSQSYYEMALKHGFDLARFY